MVQTDEKGTGQEQELGEGSSFLFISRILRSLLSLILKSGKHTVVANVVNVTGPRATEEIELSKCLYENFRSG